MWGLLQLSVCLVAVQTTHWATQASLVSSRASDRCFEQLRSSYASVTPEESWDKYVDDIADLKACTTPADLFWMVSCKETKTCPPAHRRRRSLSSLVASGSGRHPLNTSLWEEACRIHDVTITCIADKRRDCGSTFPMTYFREVEFFFMGPTSLAGQRAFAHRICRGGQVKEELAELMRTGATTDCVLDDRVAMSELERCASIVNNENLGRKHGDLYRSPQFWNRLAASTLGCVRDSLTRSRCSAEARALMYRAVTLLIPPTVDVDKLQVHAAPTLDLSTEERCSAGIFDNSKVYRCRSQSITTCKLAGQNMLLSNRFFDIFGTGDVQAGNSQTAYLTSVRIVFRGMDGASELGMYKAQNSRLLNDFTASGVTLEKDENDRTSQTLVYGALGVVVRLGVDRGRYSLVIRAPEPLLDESYGVLVTGCPGPRVISVHPLMTKTRDCETSCGDVTRPDDLGLERDLSQLKERCIYSCSQRAGRQDEAITRWKEEILSPLEKADNFARERAVTVSYPTINISPKVTSSGSIKQYRTIMFLLSIFSISTFQN